MKEQIVKVNILVEVKLYNSWGDDCTIGQVKKQAKEDAARRLIKALDGINAKILTANTVSIFSKEE